MKECKDDCELWRVSFKERGTGCPATWGYCPYCDSGKLVDKEAELKEEFWQDLYRAAEHNDDTIIFNKYEIKRKEDEP